VKECPENDQEPALEGPFFPEWEFGTIFGLQRDEISYHPDRLTAVGCHGTGMPTSKELGLRIFPSSVHITCCGTAGSILPLLTVAMFQQEPATIR
jgi:hypothetical protein